MSRKLFCRDDLFLLLLLIVDGKIIEVGCEGVESSDDFLVCIIVCQGLVIASFDVGMWYSCILG